MLALNKQLSVTYGLRNPFNLYYQGIIWFKLIWYKPDNICCEPDNFLKVQNKTRRPEGPEALT